MEVPSGFIAIIITVFGAAIGSFLNVVIWRLPRNLKLGGRSKCPKCKKQLKPKDLIPLWSMHATGRKCRYCRESISSRYSIIEATTAILFLASYLILQPASGPEWLNFFIALFVISILIVVFVIDLEHYLILDRLIFPAVILALILHLAYGLTTEGLTGSWYQTFITAILGGFVGMAPLYLLWLFSKGRWMGFGDVKLAGFIGVALGAIGVLVSLFLAFMLGTIVAIPLLVSGQKKLSSKIPFGTFLSIAAVITLFYGTQLVDWYLRLIGL